MRCQVPHWRRRVRLEDVTNGRSRGPVAQSAAPAGLAEADRDGAVAPGVDETQKRRPTDPRRLLDRRDDAGTLETGCSRGDLLCRSDEHLLSAGDGPLCAEWVIHLAQVAQRTARVTHRIGNGVGEDHGLHPDRRRTTARAAS